jgi:hypothetical protein
MVRILPLVLLFILYYIGISAVIGIIFGIGLISTGISYVTGIGTGTGSWFINNIGNGTDIGTVLYMILETVL